ncbi:alpha/beta hydrolase protein [Aspergillus niger]|nr:alpha/beta hydrolase protein [Aspergillus niger]
MGQKYPSSKPITLLPSLETFPYGTDHVLQTVTVATLNNDNNEGYWVILIHGGAWRDPTQTALNYLNPALDTLTTGDTTTLSHLKGIASISYRLSPHPSHPQDPQTTEPTHFRAAKHPDHISDVQSALSFLQGKYNIGSNYILVGHSCGATLAFQSVMGRFRAQLKEVMPSAGIVGMAGIYDLRLLRDTHRSVSAYQDFIEGAFGSDEGVWDDVSPALGRGGEGVSDGWRNIGDGEGEEKRLVAVLAYSGGDSLVDPTQREAMKKHLEEEWVGGSGRGEKVVEMLDIKGEHDDAWEKGEELARAIAFAVEKVRGE